MNLRHNGIKDIFTLLGKEAFTTRFSGKEKDGEFKKWWKNGQLAVHSFLKNGVLEGEYKRWNEDGKFLRHHIYKDGQKIKDLL